MVIAKPHKNPQTGWDGIRLIWNGHKPMYLNIDLLHSEENKSWGQCLFKKKK